MTIAEERNWAPASPELIQRYGRYLTGQRSLSANTRRIYLDDLHTFLAYCRRVDEKLTDMNRQFLRRYVAHLATAGRTNSEGKSEGYARVSIVRKLTALRTFYSFLTQEGWFKSSPVPSARSFPVKVEKKLPSFLGKKEAERLLEAPDDNTPTGLRDRAVLEILYASGVRLAEIEGMNLGDIYRERREILVRGKGNKERWTLYGEPASEALDDYLNDGRPHLAGSVSGDDPLFVNRYGGRLSRRSIEKVVSRHAARAGLKEGIHTHTLRHSFASHMLEGDADLRVIQDLLGHSSVSTTQIYTHITKQEARRAYLDFHPMATKYAEPATEMGDTANDQDTGSARA
ncbi:MAG: tyrosine-type recombinase/integrase [Chloroflexi bacterium]|nr:tyrosine-type recombinase/integrase [Chloroflexota bacterium]MYD48489.1 tyrosine-type recombinase/integrase [Chloroflexota bacterium]